MPALLALTRVSFPSKNVLELCGLLGSNATKVLVPLIQTMCRDENFEVRNNVIEGLDLVSDALGPTGLANSVLPSILELAKDQKWRVRVAVVSKLGLLGKVRCGAVRCGALRFSSPLCSVALRCARLRGVVLAGRDCCCCWLPLFTVDCPCPALPYPIVSYPARGAVLVRRGAVRCGAGSVLVLLGCALLGSRAHAGAWFQDV